MRIKLIIYFLITLCFNSFSQTQFQKTIGGTGDDSATPIITTTDGGFITVGSTNSFGTGGYDFYIVKFDRNDSLQWTKTIGGINDDIALSIKQTSDGGYIISGETDSFGAGGWDACVVKLDQNGTIQWIRTIGGTGDEYGEAVTTTFDGGYAVAGYTSSFGAGDYDLYIAKLNSEGSFQWFRTIGGTGYDYATSMKQTSDSGFVLFGSTNSFGVGYTDYYIVKFDANGVFQWNRTIGGTGGDYGYSIIQTNDRGYAMSGTSVSFGAGNLDIYIVKLDASGSLQWTRAIGGTDNEYGYNIIQTTDGGYCVAGSTNSFGAGGYDAYIVKLDNNGLLQWSRTTGGPNDDCAIGITQTPDGNYITSGYTHSFGSGGNDFFIVKFDANGNTCGNSSNPASISGSGGTVTNPTPTLTSPAPIVTTPIPAVGTEGTITNLCPVNIQQISNKVPKSFILYQNYPNPFNPNTKIKFDIRPPLTPLLSKEGTGLPDEASAQAGVVLKIFNLLGHEIATLINQKLQPGSYEVEWSATGGASNYPSGVYFYKLRITNYELGIDWKETKRMVLIK